MKIKYFFFLLLIIFFAPNIGRASKMIFEPSSSIVQKDELVKINLYLATEEDRINAAEGELIFPNDLLSVYNINYSNSILNFWPEKPHLGRDGVISFSGVTPGGFGSNSRNLLFSVVFKALKEGKAEFGIQKALALKDDGAGTSSDLKLEKGSITVTAKSSSPTLASGKLLQELDPKNDKEPPESFTPLIGSNPDLFTGKYFLVFTTNDKQSGIDHYEIQESKNKSIKNNAWIKTESPYPLIDQALRSFIFIRVFDQAQNVRLETLSPLYPHKFYQSAGFWVIIVLVCFMLLFKEKMGFLSQ